MYLECGFYAVPRRKQSCRDTRVDVSETFSADQLWFRILSGLFQRCSLPENLWTALIQLWTALKTEIFRAKNQRWNSAVQLWNRADSELNSAEIFEISETALFSADLLWDFNPGMINRNFVVVFSARPGTWHHSTRNWLCKFRPSHQNVSM